jgi:hypothetical protein
VAKYHFREQDALRLKDEKIEKLEAEVSMVDVLS